MGGGGVAPTNDATRAAAMVTVGPASGDTDDPFRAGREAAAARAQAAAARAVVVGGDAETTQDHAGNGAAQRGPGQGADAVTRGSGLPVATSRTRPIDASVVGGVGYGLGRPEHGHGHR